MAQRKRGVRATSIALIGLAGVLVAWLAAGESDPVDEALADLGATPIECYGNGWGPGPVGRVVEESRCWSLVIESSMPETTRDVVEALQDYDVAGEIEEIECSRLTFVAEGYLRCEGSLLPEDGRDDALVVWVDDASADSEDRDEWVAPGTSGTVAEVVVGVGDHIGFAPGEWSSLAWGALIRLDPDGTGQVWSLPVWMDAPIDCFGADLRRVNGDIVWTRDGDGTAVSITLVEGDFGFDLEALHVAGGDWRMVNYTACNRDPVWLFRDDA